MSLSVCDFADGVTGMGWTPDQCAADWPALRRALVRWHGGKFLMAKTILGYLDVPHDCYTEAFGGAASVLLRKSPSPVEVLNDLDDELVNFYRVIRDESLSETLRDALEMTPYSRVEFLDAHRPAPEWNLIERARRFAVRQSMSFAPQANRPTAKATAFRNNSSPGRAPVRDWAGYPDFLAGATKRLRGVMIESRPAVEVLRDHDRAGTLHYVDPPYVPETRGAARKGYRHEMDVSDHAALLDALVDLDGMVCLSGYASAIYDERLVDWQRIEKSTRDLAGQGRTEVLWLNPALVAARAKAARHTERARLL